MAEVEQLDNQHLPVLRPGQEADSFVFFGRRLGCRLQYSSEDEVEVPEEPSARNKWTDELSHVKKYVDDGIQIDKLNF